MKRLVVLVCLCAFSFGLHAQIVDTTVCEILKNPAAFNGKTVRIKGSAIAGFDEFIVKGTGCGQHVNAIWLSYPEGSKAKAGPAAVLQLRPAQNFSGNVAAIERTPVSLDKNKDFKQFDSLLSTPYKSGGMCLGCVRYLVNATLVGRLDGTVAELKRDTSGKIVGISGFGNLNAYSARLVLQSVSDIAPQEIDYSKTATISKGDSTSDSGGDPVAGAHQAAQAFGPGNPLGQQVERAAAAFGKEGDDNGVEVSFSGANEASKSAEQKSQSKSPDGVLFNCVFDPNRLKGDALGRAIVHAGQSVADLRDPQTGSEAHGLYQMEYRAWVTTALSAIASRQKTLTIPGGYLLWNSAWPGSELNKHIDDALTSFLTDEYLLSK